MGRRTSATVGLEKKHLIRILKKGGLTKCENYRGITLLSVPENVFKTKRY